MARKTGILGGILALLIAFIANIPIYPPANIEINFLIFTNNNTAYYIWGYVSNNLLSFSPLTAQFPENLIGIFIWGLMVFLGLSSIMASVKKANFENSMKLYWLNILCSIFVSVVYTIIIILTIWENLILFFYTAGIGYYLLIIILGLNIIALHYLKKSEI
jgi:hypothetical protein